MGQPPSETPAACLLRSPPASPGADDHPWRGMPSGSVARSLTVWLATPTAAAANVARSRPTCRRSPAVRHPATQPGRRSPHAPCRCARPRSSGSAPWSERGSSLCSARQARWPARPSGSRSSSRAVSPRCRATPSPRWVPDTRRPAASSSTSSAAGDRGTSPASSPGCFSRSTRSSPRWWRSRSAATPAQRSPTTPTGSALSPSSSCS